MPAKKKWIKVSRVGTLKAAEKLINDSHSVDKVLHVKHNYKIKKVINGWDIYMED